MSLNRDRVLAVLAAFCLWFAGNMLLAVPSHSQEVPSGKECASDPPSSIVRDRCQYTPGENGGSCSHACVVEVLTTSSCKPTDAWYGQFPCRDNAGVGFGNVFASGCVLDPGAGCACLPGQPVDQKPILYPGLGCEGATPL